MTNTKVTDDGAAPNVLLITLDQFRGDCLSAAGHPIVRTPNLDALAAEGVRFARHYSQASPCAPGRASLYTGMYQMNHRVVANGTPLDDRFDNIARIARRAGYVPTLFGYTDQSIDPRVTTGADDPRLGSYEGVLPGFDCALDLTGDHDPWRRFLADTGHDVSGSIVELLSTEHERPADASVSALLTTSVVEWISQQRSPWFAHASYLRPHPPYSAAGEYSSMYGPEGVGEPLAPAEERHPYHDLLLAYDQTRAPSDPAALARMRAQYFGMISEVDHQLGRLWAELKRLGAWDDTIIVLTADHGEMLGDHGLREKVGYWEQSQHVPCIVRSPFHRSVHGTVVTEFTENVDIVPTVCEAIGAPIPAQCDGLPLTPFLHGDRPPWWRTAAHWEFDWRYVLIPSGAHGWPWHRRLEQCTLSVRRDERTAYVQFGDGTWLCFDLEADPTWRTRCEDDAAVATQLRAMLTWRMEHANREHTSFLVEAGGTGRWPANVPWRE